MEQNQLLDIPLEVWQCCIFEYWLGPIDQIELKTHDQIMNFKQNMQHWFVEGLNLSNVRTIQKFCCATSKRFRELFVNEMNEFWRRVSNVLEMVVYWKRYQSSEGLSLATELFTKDCSDSTSLGLMVNLSQDMDIFGRIASQHIALTINLNEWTYQGFTIPNHIQILCFRFESVTFDEESLLFENFLQEEGVFSNVKDLTIKFSGYEGFGVGPELMEKVEMNIIAGITRNRFPKLLRISIQGFSVFENLMECDLLREVPYVEIIPTSIDFEYERITNWSQRKVHGLVEKQFITNDSLIQHLLVHANISISGGEADFDSVKEYYDLSLGKFVASISHSSYNEYYDTCIAR